MHPPSTEDVRSRLATMLPALRARYGVRALAIFGSYAREEQVAGSDLDLLVDLDATLDLFTLGALVLDIEEALGVRVDLFTRSTLKPGMVVDVERDLVAV